MTKTEIREFLDKLEDAGAIDFYVLQSRMPGLRWSVYVKGQPGRVMTTRQVQQWIDGYVIGAGFERSLHLDEREVPPEEPYRYSTGEDRD